MYAHKAYDLEADRADGTAETLSGYGANLSGSE